MTNSSLISQVGKNKNPRKYWVDMFGKQWLIVEMLDEHLKNAIAYIKREMNDPEFDSAEAWVNNLEISLRAMEAEYNTR